MPSRGNTNKSAGGRQKRIQPASPRPKAAVAARTEGRKRAARSCPGRTAASQVATACATPALHTAGEPASGAMVVGIGSSAGGLEACKQFFAGVPSDSGLVFVLVSHLDPSGKSLLPEILAQNSHLHVCQAADGMAIAPDHLYVAPAGGLLTIATGGVLRVSPLEGSNRPLLPIDAFLRSLAQERGDNSICIILSGAGSDGTLGLKAIKEVGGLTLVQEAISARHDGMPRSAIATGLVDHVLPVERMPAVLLDYARHAAALRDAQVGPAGPEEFAAELPRIFGLLRNRTGHDFAHYKRNTIVHRIQHRMQLLQLTRPKAYREYLRDKPAEIMVLFRDLLIGVTHFFRDREAFVALQTRVIPSLFSSEREDQPPRIWVPGCATGEEAYSIAILLAEHMATLGKTVPVQIFATDLDERSLEVARVGRYPEGIVADVPAPQLQRFFVSSDQHYQVSKQIREMVVFSAHSLIRDPPFSRLDLISCRNVLIYLGLELQQRILPLFHFALKPEGFLFLGPSETIARSTLFAMLDKKHKLFQKRAAGVRPPLKFPLFAAERGASERAAGVCREPRSGAMLVKRVEQLLLEEYAPACVVIDEHDDVVHFQGHTGAYLEAPAGVPDMNLLRLARRGLRAELRAALLQAVRQPGKLVRHAGAVRTEGGLRSIQLVIRPLGEPGLEGGLRLVAFQDAGPAPKPAATLAQVRGCDAPDALVEQLERELRSTQENLQATTEELESTNEELRSSNEELLSANEELQSSNEELESSREELQSSNEELDNVNQVLNSHVEQLARANSDMQNLFASTQIATVFLDGELRIKSFTPAITEIFSLLPTDVGRPLGDFAQRVSFEDLAGEARRVLSQLVVSEHQVQSRSGDWYIMRMLPYRTLEGVVDGVLITFVDVTVLKRTEQALRRSEADSRRLATVVRDSNDAVTVQDFSGHILAWNRGAERMYGYTEAEALNQSVRDTICRHRRAEALTVAERVARGEEVGSFETQRITKNGRTLDVWLTTTVITDETGKPVAFGTTERDVTARKQAEEQARQHQVEFTHVARVASMGELAAGLAHELNQPLCVIVSYARAAQRYLGAEGVDTKKLRDMLTEIANSGKLAGDIIRRLRDLMQKRAAQRGPLQINHVICELAALVGVEARQHRASIRYELADNLPRVLGDRIQLQQVLMNLVRNGLEAMRDHKPGSQPLVIRTGLAEGGAVEVSVQDCGVGVAAEVAEHMFEPFFTTKTGGLGIGLSLCHGIIEAHQGRIWATPNPDGGATLHFTLPAFNEERDEK
jgi:two-component system, chemotaxis family, CheB/CheR fusion protein